MTALHIRSIDAHTMAKLKAESEAKKLSVNALVIQLLEKGVGVTHAQKKITYHDLDQYAGTWTQKEASLFLNKVAHFEKIDEELWQ